MFYSILAVILKEWAGRVESILKCKVSYLQELGIPMMASEVRRLNMRVVDNTPLLSKGDPVLFFSRTPLRPFEDFGRKPSNAHGSLQALTRTKALYKFRMLEVVLNCIFATKDWDDLEQFELNYALNLGISSIMDFPVDFGGEVGALRYSLHWDSLDDKQSLDNIDVKVLFFTCKLYGCFVAGGVDRDKLIERVKIFYRDYGVESLIEMMEVRNARK